MLIEFLGLPGCGKSTLSRLVADLLMEQRVVVEETTYNLDHRRRKLGRQRAKLTHVVSFVARNPRSAFGNLVAIAVTQQASLADMRKVSLNWLYILSVAARRRSPTAVTILDQGIGQAMWSIGFAAQRASWLDLLPTKVQQATAMPDLVVHVRADFATIGDRLAARKRHVSRMDTLRLDLEALRRGETNGNAIAAKLQAIGVPVIEIENNDAVQLAQGAHRVADLIMAVVSEQKTEARLRHQGGMPRQNDAAERVLLETPLVQRTALPRFVETQVNAKATQFDNGV